MALFKRAAAAAAAFVIVALLALGSVFAAEQSGLSVGFEFVEGAGGGLKLTLESVPAVEVDNYITCVRFKLRYDTSAFSIPTGSGYIVTPVASNFPAAIEDQLILVSTTPGVVEFCYIDWVTVESILKGTGQKRNLFASGQSVTIPYLQTPGSDLSAPHVFEVFDVRYGLNADIEVSQLYAGTGVTVTVTAGAQYQRGDVDRDGDVDSSDAVYLLRYVLFPASYNIEDPVATADFTGDGFVTSDDAVYLLRHVLFPSEYPLT